jgi:hypothetical protein
MYNSISNKIFDFENLFTEELFGEDTINEETLTYLYSGDRMEANYRNICNFIRTIESKLLEVKYLLPFFFLKGNTIFL